MEVFMEFIKDLFKDPTLQDVISIASLFAMVIGGCFALHQWKKGLRQKRAETIEQLIKTVRDNEDIASIMDIIDWDNGFYYDGKFHLYEDTGIANLKDISDEDLFKKIDKTLIHFSYICYLRNQNILSCKDMRHFDYEIQRLADNQHIANYLHSLYHWSAYLGATMSFSFLLNYCINKKYLFREIKRAKTSKYYNYLEVAEENFNKNNFEKIFNKIKITLDK